MKDNKNNINYLGMYSQMKKIMLLTANILLLSIIILINYSEAQLADPYNPYSLNIDYYEYLPNYNFNSFNFISGFSDSLFKYTNNTYYGYKSDFINYLPDYNIYNYAPYNANFSFYDFPLGYNYEYPSIKSNISSTLLTNSKDGYNNDYPTITPMIIPYYEPITKDPYDDSHFVSLLNKYGAVRVNPVAVRTPWGGY